MLRGIVSGMVSGLVSAMVRGLVSAMLRGLVSAMLRGTAVDQFQQVASHTHSKVCALELKQAIALTKPLPA